MTDLTLLSLRRRLIALCAAAITATTMTMAQEQQLRTFTLEDLNFGGNNYRNMVPQMRYTAWWGDRLVSLDDEQCSLVDGKGRETTLFTLEQMQLATGGDDHSRLRHLYNCEFPYKDKPVVRLLTGKELILADWKKGKVVCRFNRDGAQAEALAPQSKALATVRDSQLWVAVAQDDGAEPVETQLTTDGSRHIVYGQSVHRDEFGIDRGLFWSPDGRKLAFYRMDQSMVADYPQVEMTDSMAQCKPDKYPMAGQTSHKVTVGVYDIDTRKTIYLQAGDPTDRYFTNVAWNPESSQLYMFELNRDQNDCRLTCYDAATGQKLSELYRETDERYVEPLHPIVFLPWDKTKFVMQSQRDGYNHLYLFDRNGKQLRQLTSGQWVVMELVGFCKKLHSAIIVANKANPIQANIYLLNIDNGKLTPLDNGAGYHHALLSDGGNRLLDIYSAPDTPRNIDIITLADKPSTQRLLTAPDPWQGYEIPHFESGTITAADGITPLYYRMVKPASFDPSKKYPTVVYVYGGPHAHLVDARWHWGARSWETYMAQKGYIVFVLDNRGSENRGKAFEQTTFRQLGQVEMQDQVKGVEYLWTLPYVDKKRMGIHGWSFGGFMTISMMTNFPDLFKVGVAGGPVIDWKWYEVMYGERYMDTPQQNPEGYAKTSLLDKARNLKGKLQIITGYNDPTVVPQHCLSFLAACIEAGTQPDFFVYPGEPHNMRGHQSVHLHERITQYFDDYLK